MLLLLLILLAATPRSSTVAHRFMRDTGFPHGRPGWVVDHIIPLASGGCDCAENLQWQKRDASLEKDKWERCVPPWVLIRLYGRGKMAPSP